jgi:hypothetical protein
MFGFDDGNVCSWHFSDMPRQPDDVRSPGKSRHPAARSRLPGLTQNGPRSIQFRCAKNSSRSAEFGNWVYFYGEVQRAGDKTHFVRFMMKVFGGLRVSARRKRHYRFQDNRRELACAVCFFNHKTFCIVFIRNDDNAGPSAQAEIPKLMTRGSGRQEQFFGIPPRSVAPKTRIR